MIVQDHDHAAHHHRHEAHTHEAAADLAVERGDNVGADQHRELHAFHLRTAHHHETQAMLARLAGAEIPANRPSDESILS